jgi:hypothetical protein
MSTDTMASNAPASPESAIDDEYLRLQAAKIVADARLEVATEKRKAEKDKAATDAERAEEDKEWQASQDFSSAHHAWLIAKAALEEPSVVLGAVLAVGAIGATPIAGWSRNRRRAR